MVNRLEGKPLTSADEVKTFPLGKVELVTLAGVTIGRATMQPGWRWSQSVKPLVKTERCQVAHTGYMVSGRLRVAMADGAEQEFGPGEAFAIPPGHDAWVVGDEPAVNIDFAGASVFAAAL
jgi:mannose-6-phosphate isomerase-like protein (cupin superfamily)